MKSGKLRLAAAVAALMGSALVLTGAAPDAGAASKCNPGYHRVNGTCTAVGRPLCPPGQYRNKSDGTCTKQGFAHCVGTTKMCPSGPGAAACCRKAKH
jgi:hypothetical protein